ncbi:MAG: NTP transferase domain-containing protein, partial [Nanoarchaeota archaeon]|nr:NTP transferase domain-containing protein [Nanoarchaeota archaeon]
MVNYKVCILAAGIGSRMGPYSEHISKALLPVDFKAVISHILEKFPEEIEIVVAIGHKKETVRDYLSIAHPERKITFVEIDNYIGPGTGPGYSLLRCKNNLQCPFIFFTSDTLVLEKIPEPSENWFGIAPVKETEKYCTVKIKNNLIYQMDDKIKCDNKYAFIGLAGVRDYENFWQSLERNKEPSSGEIQVSNGFKGLIEKGLVPTGFTWFDTGTFENYKEVNKNFSGGHKDFDFSKGNEFLYFVNGRVIKFFADAEIAKKRVLRAEHLKGLTPEIESHRNNFYSYKKKDGQVLYSILNAQIVSDFLQWAKKELWQKIELNEEESKEFKEATKKFYYEKTMERLENFYKKSNLSDERNNINGVEVPPLNELLSKIDWNYICDSVPVKFHGDLQFDNILVTKEKDSPLSKFVLLDWRHDFGGLTHVGDLYYDLAKLYGGMIISYQLIKKGDFSFDMSGLSVHYNYAVKNDLLEAKDEFESFVN